MYSGALGDICIQEQQQQKNRYVAQQTIEVYSEQITSHGHTAYSHYPISCFSNFHYLGLMSDGNARRVIYEDISVF